MRMDLIDSRATPTSASGLRAGSRRAGALAVAASVSPCHFLVDVSPAVAVQHVTDRLLGDTVFIRQLRLSYIT